MFRWGHTSEVFILKIKLATAIAAAIIFTTMVPAIPAAAGETQTTAAVEASSGASIGCCKDSKEDNY